MPIYLAGEGERVVISTEMSSVKHAFSRKRTKTVLSDPVFAPSLATLDESPTMLIAACPGRIGEMARPFMAPGEATEMAPVLALLDDTSVTLSTQHSNTTFALGARVHNIPDVSGLVTQAIAQQRRGGHGPRPVEAGATKTAKSGGAESMMQKFEQLAHTGERDAAAQLADRMAATIADAKALNNLAWALLTEDRYDGEYDDVALVLSRRSNELSDHSNWYYLDTLALAEFRQGDARRAAELQERVLELSGGEGEQAELQRSLDLYRTKSKEWGDPLVHSEAR